MDQVNEEQNVGNAVVDRETGTVAEPQDSITLKWGTLKAWRIKTPAAKALLERWTSLGFSHGAMTQRDTPEQKELLCQMIDASDVETVYLDWDGIAVSKQEAKDYILNYGQAS